MYLPSSNPKPSDPARGVEWEVVRIVRSSENLFPTMACAEEEKRLAELFSLPELKALAAIRESKDGTFDMNVCGLQLPTWSAEGKYGTIAYVTCVCFLYNEDMFNANTYIELVLS